MTCNAAIDLSSSEAAFAVADTNRQVIIEEFLPTRGRESAGIVNWMTACLKQNDLKPADITHWTVGTGPGSFTGLRMISSLVTGLTFQQPEINAIGIPSAMALAAALSETDEPLAVLYDGRRGEVLIFPVIAQNGLLQPHGEAKALSKEECQSGQLSSYPQFAALEKDRSAICQSILPEIEKRINFISHFPVGNLLNRDWSHCHTDTKDLVYIRPAVFVKPQTVRDPG